MPIGHLASDSIVKISVWKFNIMLAVKKTAREIFMNKKIIIGVLVTCLLAFVAVFAFSQSNTNVRWEYNLIMYDNNGGERTVIQRANELGKQGWELVSYTYGDYGQMFFKRRLP